MSTVERQSRPASGQSGNDRLEALVPGGRELIAGIVSKYEAGSEAAEELNGAIVRHAVQNGGTIKGEGARETWLIRQAVRICEQHVVRQVLAGANERFEILIREYQSRIFATARKYARRESEIEDIVQEVFIRAYQKLSTYRAEAPFEHWLMRLAVRVCYDFLRSHQKNRESSFTDITDDNCSFLERYVSDPHPDAERHAAIRTLIYRILEQLSPRSRQVIVMQELEGKSIKEISSLTGCSISLVKVRAFRARKEMRKIIEKMDKSRYL